MVKRLLELPKDHTFFLFGARQTGKSTLLRSTFHPQKTLTYDLLKTEEHLRLSAQPRLFREEVLSRDRKVTHVVVDEIQRIPDLLNEVHSLLEGRDAPSFCLSGSSARKLKRAQANLLAGRAWTYHLYPFTHVELGSDFSLDRALHRGTLPSVYLAKNEEEAHRTLRAYVETYLKEEIQEEALVRNLGGFLRFLSLAADENGNVLNYSNIARETGASYKTVKEYFQLLEDTLVGFLLLPYSKAVRKRLIAHPKFYFFDTGVHRAMAKELSAPLQRGTSEYGRVFEHFLVTEFIRLIRYREWEAEISFYHSSSHMEVDLVIEIPPKRCFAIEIKAAENPSASDLRGLKAFRDVRPQAELYLASLAPRKRMVAGIAILPWQEALKAVGLT